MHVGRLLVRLPQHVADPHRAETLHLRDATGGHRRAAHGVARVEDPEPGDGGLVAVPDPDPVAHPQRPRVHPHERDPLPRRTPLDLEDRCGQRVSGVAGARRQQLRDARHHGVDAGAGHGRAEEHRVDAPGPDLLDELAAHPHRRHRFRVVGARGQERVVVLGEPVDEPLRERGVAVVVRVEGGLARAEVGHLTHRDHVGREACRQVGQHGVVRRTGAVDLVHEDQRRDAEPLQRAHQHAGLRLHALDGRDHQHRAVEHAEHPLDLGDEVGVAGGVDQVDRHALDDERDHRGLDGDAALPLEREAVGLGAAVVDAADLVDDTGGVQQPLGQGGLTGVDVRHDSEVQGCHDASCPSRE